MAAVKRVAEFIATNKIAMISKSYCPFCDMAKNALKSVGADFKVMEIEDMPECQEIQDYMQKITGARSVPRVFINEKFVGGGSEMKAYVEKGQLADMCK